MSIVKTNTLSNYDGTKSVTVGDLVDRVGSAKSAIQDTIDQLILAGYTYLGKYASGLVVVTAKHFFELNNNFYVARPGYTLPFTTTGVWQNEYPKFQTAEEAKLVTSYAQLVPITNSTGTFTMLVDRVYWLNTGVVKAILPSVTGTFRRSSIATRFNDQGYLEQVAANVARFEFDPATLKPLGLLIEAATSNYLLYSNLFTNAAWTKTNVTLTSDADSVRVGGTSTKVTPTSTAPVLSQTVSGVNNQTVSLSFVVKASGAPFAQIKMQASNNSSNYVNVQFNLTTGVPSAINNSSTTNGFTSPVASSKPLGRGWYRVTLRVTLALSGSLVCFVAPSGNESGTSLGLSQAILVDHAQLETGSVSSYMPTSGTSLLRSADVLLGGVYYPAITVGTRIPLNKAVSASPVIESQDSTPIVINGKSDTSFNYNLNAPIWIVWNGTSWEV